MQKKQPESDELTTDKQIDTGIIQKMKLKAVILAEIE